MTRITIFAAGSQGDIQPCLILGRGLRKTGIDVLLAAPQNFAEMAAVYEVPFHPLRGDVQQIMAGETGRKYMESGGSNPIQSIIAMRKMIGPIAMQMTEDALEACRESDVLVSLSVFAPFGKTIAEIRGIPLINIEPTPVLPTEDFPAPGWPVQKDLGRFLNRFSGSAMLRVIWQWYGSFINEFRTRFGLLPLAGSDFRRILESAPLVGAYSSTVIPRPRDWPDKTHITGYLFQDDLHTWIPSTELETFLSQGEPPLYIGFGSMSGRNTEHFSRVVLDALAKSGQRGVLAKGWGGIDMKHVPDNVFLLESAPHKWLFPRMSAVVHHGGAGTTAEGLRAGVPNVIIPFIVDQLFWGKRVHRLGAGPDPIQAKKLTADKLADAIRAAVADSKMKQCAESIGKSIRAEDGLGSAVQVIKNYLGA